MPELRDFLGQSCPRCAQDILQQAPSSNRMPTAHAWCPSCQAVLSVEDLAKRVKAPGLLKRLFGNPQRT